MKTERLRVDLSGRAYDIVVGAGVLKDATQRGVAVRVGPAGRDGGRDVLADAREPRRPGVPAG
ncbi:MAG: hypothetical protein ACK6A4_03025, partial [Alphaproteobacteria bacterium]